MNWLAAVVIALGLCVMRLAGCGVDDDIAPTTSSTTPVTAPPNTAAPSTTPSADHNDLPTPREINDPTPSAAAAPPGEIETAPPSEVAQRWVPSPGTTWQWQLTTPVDTSVDVQVYDIDGTENGADVVQRLH